MKMVFDISSLGIVLGNAQPAVLQAEEKRARNSVPVSCFSQPIGQLPAQAA